MFVELAFWLVPFGDRGRLGGLEQREVVRDWRGEIFGVWFVFWAMLWGWYWLWKRIMKIAKNYVI